jgi:hypothetical protein
MLAPSDMSVADGWAASRSKAKSTYVLKPMCMVARISAKRGRCTPPSTYSHRARRRLYLSPFWVIHETLLNSMVQLVSHVCPASSENACSQRAWFEPLGSQIKRTLIGFPLCSSSP